MKKDNSCGTSLASLVTISIGSLATIVSNTGIKRKENWQATIRGVKDTLALVGIFQTFRLWGKQQQTHKLRLRRLSVVRHFGFQVTSSI